MNSRISVLLFFAVITLASPLFGEPVPDLLIGKIILRNSTKLDAQAKKDLAAFAMKIKRMKSSGTVKITGNISMAQSQDDYAAKSVFMAQLAETYLKTVLSANYQTFITASKYTDGMKPGQNSVEIQLYPHELKVEGPGYISTITTSGEIKKQFETRTAQPAPKVPDVPPAASSLTPPASDSEQVEVSSRKERLTTENEDPVLANELVNKAKARAAQKAKRLEQE